MLHVCACGESGRGSGKPPNVLLYIVDTLRADSWGGAGSRLETPAIARFAREGVSFSNAFANASWTRPSVGSILTGLYPNHHGARGRNDILREEVDTLADLLAREGYATAFVTANPNTGSAFGFASGFDEMIELYDRREPGRVENDELAAASGDVTDRVLDWIGESSRPFFVVVHVVEPHAPYSPPTGAGTPPSNRDRAEETATLDTPAEDLTRGDRLRFRAHYESEVSLVDASFGVLIESLRGEGILDRTLTVFTSDHGEEFWEYAGRRGHGKSLSDSVIHVPLLVRYPSDSRVEAGSRVDHEVELVDIFPTVLDLLDLSAANPVDGHSLFAPTEPGRQSVYSSLDLDGIRMDALRSFPTKLVWNGNQDRYEFYTLPSSRKELKASGITRKNEQEYQWLKSRLDEIRRTNPD